MIERQLTFDPHSTEPVFIVSEEPTPIESRIKDRFDLKYWPEPESVAVYINGLRIRKSAYISVGTPVILNPHLALKEGDWICVDYVHIPANSPSITTAEAGAAD